MAKTTELTVNQSTDLARYFLGPKWYGWMLGDLYILGTITEGMAHTGTGWREVFRAAGVKLPLRTRFVRHRVNVLRGDEMICIAHSGTMAQRIANALNEYEPGERGF